MNLELIIDDRIIKGWNKTKVKYSLNTLSACAVIHMSDNWNTALKMKANSPVILKNDGKAILTGILVKRKTLIDCNIHEISWEIRSSSSILAKSDLPPPASQIDGTSLKTAIQTLTNIYKIPLTFNSNDVSLSSLNLNYGDSVGTIIEKLCRESKLVYAPASNGGIKIFDANIGVNAGTLIFHKTDIGKNNSNNNIIGAKTSMSITNRHNNYYTTGQHTPIEGEDLNDAYSTILKITDKEINDNSSFCIFADDGANLKNCGIIERARHIKDSIIIEYALKTKTNAKGKLWEVGDIVTVDDDVNDIYGNFIISDVVLGLSNTTECWLTLSPPEAFILKNVTIENQYGDKKMYECPSFYREVSYMNIDELNKWGRKFYNRIVRLIGRSTISSVKVGEPNKTLFTAKIKGAGGTVCEGTEIFNDYGFISFPPDGSEAIIIYPRGDKNNKGIIVKTVNRQFLPTSLKVGDSAMFDNRGQLIIMSNDGISITDSNNCITMNKSGINLNGVIIDNKGATSFPSTVDADDVITSKKDVIADTVSLTLHITEVPGEGLMAGTIKVSGMATSLPPKK